MARAAPRVLNIIRGRMDCFVRSFARAFEESRKFVGRGPKNSQAWRAAGVNSGARRSTGFSRCSTCSATRTTTGFDDRSQQELRNAEFGQKLAFYRAHDGVSGSGRPPKRPHPRLGVPTETRHSGWETRMMNRSFRYAINFAV